MKYSLLLLLGSLPAFLFCSIVSAQPAPNPDPIYQLIPPDHSGVTFNNKITDTKYFNVVNYINAYNGSGMAAGDFDGDGLADLYFASTQLGSRMYLNRGDFRFKDVTQRSGTYDSGLVVRGVSIVDINGDGHLDIYTCRTMGANHLYVNKGNGTFTEQAKKYGLDVIMHSTQSIFLDYDLDGDLDMYLVSAGGSSVSSFARHGEQDRIYRNNRGKFVDVTKSTGIQDRAYGLSVVSGDMNNDGWPDLYVANDFEGQDCYYLNNRNGTFTNVQSTYLGHTSNSAMGSDIADFNNDGWLDIFVDDMLAASRKREVTLGGSMSILSTVYDSSQVSRNTLQLNRGNGICSDIAMLAGVCATEWSWGTLMIDLDNDGWKDIWVVNGIRRDMTNKDRTHRVTQAATSLDIARSIPQTLIPNYAFRNNRDLTFTDVSAEWGLNNKAHSNSVAYADFDNDGDLDLAVNNIDTVAFIYRNMTRERQQGNYLRIKLDGPKGNSLGIGSRVEVVTGQDGYQVHEMQTMRGYLGAVEPIIHIGVGTNPRIDTLRVTWSGGATQTLTNVEANQLLTLSIKDAKPAKHKPKPQVELPGLFTTLERRTVLPFRHFENFYDDLRRERLLPYKISQFGPGMAVGDVDGDGLEDVYMGQPVQFPGELYRQKTGGRFVKAVDADAAAFKPDSLSEDMGSVFFDADGDTDLDLYVVSGSTEYDQYSEKLLQDRLYMNNGKGLFTAETERLPVETENGSCVVASDFDRDGDLDLFVGGRTIPGKFPMTSRSFLLRNDSARFTDITAEFAPELVRPGMVQMALWTDYDADGFDDLMVVGHWIAPMVMHNDAGHRLVRATGTGLNNYTGWWNSIAPGDFDNDGDIDYILGNFGTNWRFNPTMDKPLRVYAKDFDNNGSLDLMQIRWDNGVEYPFRDRMQLAEQMPFVNQKFTTWEAFSEVDVEKVIPRKLLDSAIQVSAAWNATSYVENLGSGRFRISALPALAQLSPTFGLSVKDFDADGNLDVLIAGNFYDGPEPDLVRYDAGIGLLLLGDGAGHLEPVDMIASGIHLRGDARGIGTLRPSNGNTLLQAVINNGDETEILAIDYAKLGAKLFTASPSEAGCHGIITMDNGSHRRVEFPIGSGYLTHSSPTIVVTKGMQKIAIYRGSQLLREVIF